MMFGFGLWKIGVVAVVAITLVGAGLAYDRHRYNKGWRAGSEATLAAVAKQNWMAAGAAKVVAKTIDDCFDGGGAWDVVTGKCVK